MFSRLLRRKSNKQAVLPFEIPKPPVDPETGGEYRPPVGHMISHPYGLVGTQGVGYDYILDRHGVMIQARNDDVVARIPVSPTMNIRGLWPVETKLELYYGPIPGKLFMDALNIVMDDPKRERFCAITSNYGKPYKLVEPEQEVSPVHVRYRPAQNTVFEIHSHGRMKAFFSSKDNDDEQGLAIYAVVGDLESADQRPTLAMRVGVYGHWMDLMDRPDLIAKIFNPVPDFIKRRLWPDDGIPNAE